jgi:vacuolar-type H+-ATPase subunit H
MSDEINLISEIREAERKAEDLVSAARIEGEAAIERIREEYRQKTLIAEKDFSAARTGIIERAEKDAGAESLRMSEETEREIARIKLNAEQRIEKASDFIMRKMLE